ncbi:hypothetical protein KSS87_001566 [Heliosperma pusillum]|nr:hypothetical protein KSS87_001566 [Heliosperma pusillum]
MVLMMRFRHWDAKALSFMLFVKLFGWFQVNYHGFSRYRIQKDGLNAFDLIERIYDIHVAGVVGIENHGNWAVILFISTRAPNGFGGARQSWHRIQPAAAHDSGIVCKYWLRGNCTRNQCRFLHSHKAILSNLPSQPLRVVTKRANEVQNARNVKRRTSPEDALDNKVNEGGITKKPFVEEKVVESVKHRAAVDQKPTAVCNDVVPEKVLQKICVDWVKKSCVLGEKCKYMHSWSSSNDFSKMVQLEGHQKAVTGINLLSGSDKLFTSSEDGTVRMWNCHTGKCIVEANMGSPVWCLASEGPWVFAGITNAIKAWNIETQLELTLNAPGGHVYSLDMVDGVLYCGLQDGSILVWKLNSEAASFEGPMLVKGHTGAVVSLFRGANLYSGSVDKTVKIWDYKNMVCIHTLQKHSEEVMSVLCWERFLLSSSLDKTIKVWGFTEAGNVEVIYTHFEDNGILSLSGMHDAAGNPILLCSCNDNSVRLYDLPSFVERGRIYANEDVRKIHIGPRGQFFTGDEAGAVSVWRCSGDFSGLLDNISAA